MSSSSSASSSSPSLSSSMLVHRIYIHIYLHIHIYIYIHTIYKQLHQSLLIAIRSKCLNPTSCATSSSRVCVKAKPTLRKTDCVSSIVQSHVCQFVGCVHLQLISSPMLNTAGILYSTVYAILYISFYSRLHSMLYSVCYSLLHSTSYTICYRMFHIVVYIRFYI